MIEKDEHEYLQNYHCSINDKDGNMVSCSDALKYTYGSGIVVPGQGNFLNNEIDDFVAKAGEVNVCR
ncbi:gamma-glutamyltransferase [Francisella tularensis]|uniref:gamma-glutamyltransferase n=1 Tax=Francisella tularensis TaxID=263 RepID=UPI00295B278D|nr:gamma-glutamyltransferase [Francisella tularensis]